MAVKTITIDVEAYRLLGRQKRKGESFSKVIKRRLHPERTAAALLEALPAVCLDKATLAAVERVVADRPRSVAASTPLELEGRDVR